MATLDWLRSLPGKRQVAGGDGQTTERLFPDRGGGLNWKGRLVERFQRGLGAMMFPDIRAEWNPWARKVVRRLLQDGGVGVLVTSHEPASVLALGQEARRAGVPWVADLGDPVAAPYTPPRWRRRALRLEGVVCEQADHVTVTSDATRSLLMARHGVDGRRITVIPQGFDAALAIDAQARSRADRPLELLYTGSLYAFRRIDELLEAVVDVPGVRLAIASRRMPRGIIEWRERYPGRVRLLGAVTHAHALELQRTADVLVDLGNDAPEQVPGKFYEYLGAARPILHIGDGKSAAAGELSALRRGWICAPERTCISTLLRELVELGARGRLEAGLDLGQEAVHGYSWQASAAKMARVLRTAAAG
ncbi:glycosyltransferase [Luteimonas lutimaris]|uniref:Glycosyltransferase subfamily 4-like N-terminal domain-containing protein n=1 Tax=Luteimonas lutimaris TaxID=698645 RepID=A0ABP7MYG7_9GAMM